MSQQKGISFKEFRQRFQTEEACEEHLFQQRWSDGFVYQGDSIATIDRGVRYVEVDGFGKILGETQALPGVRLSNDCQPVLIDGGVTWYINTIVNRIFCQISV